jgi:hypothetical protein
MQRTSTTREPRRESPKRRNPVRMTITIVAIFVTGLVALTAIQLTWASEWSKDLNATNAGVNVLLQFKADQIDSGLNLSARVRDEGGFLMQVSSVTFVVVDQDQLPIRGPLEAEPIGIFGATGEGSYVASFGPIEAGSYQVQATIKHRSAIFEPVWPLEVD